MLALLFRVGLGTM